MKNTTLLIQGNLREGSYRFYCSMYPNTPKVFSTWKNNRVSCGWKGDYTLHGKNDILIESDFPNRIGYWDRRMELKILSTMRGLDHVKTEFAIKLRGDEWYSNLAHVEKIIEEDKEDRIFMTPVFLKKWEVWPFRMSDHLLAGKSSNIRLMFKSALVRMIYGEEMLAACWPLPYQSILAMSYLKEKMASCEDWKKCFVETFGIIELERLKFYKVNSEDGNTTWYSNFKPYLNSMDQI